MEKLSCEYNTPCVTLVSFIISFGCALQHMDLSSPPRGQTYTPGIVSSES